MHCGGSGTTRLLIHKIPYFRELIIASFSCEWSPNDVEDEDEDDDKEIEAEGDSAEVKGCGYVNNEVTFGGKVQKDGCIFELVLKSRRDLDRQIIKSDSSTLRIPEIDFEIPSKTQKGEISTIEGFLSRAAKNLALYQEQRMEQQPEVGARVAEIIESLSNMASGNHFPFTIIGMK